MIYPSLQGSSFKEPRQFLEELLLLLFHRPFIQYYTMAASHSGIDLQEIVNTWLQENPDRKYSIISNGVSGHAPWEGWLQVELACTVMDDSDKTLRVDRYDFVYDGGNEASYFEVINGTSRTIVELKCEKSDTPGNLVVDGVVENRENLKRGLYDEYRPAKCLSVGVAVSEEAIQAIQDHELFKKGEMKGFFCPNNKVYFAFLEFMVEKS
jgi:hypothetical protein